VDEKRENKVANLADSVFVTRRKEEGRDTRGLKNGQEDRPSAQCPREGAGVEEAYSGVAGDEWGENAAAAGWTKGAGM